MAQNVTIAGASYMSVPAINVPKTGGGTATFIESSELSTIRTVQSKPSDGTGKNGDLFIKVVI